jgi:YegS/Rv2252/BmrU family lipid kinase
MPKNKIKLIFNPHAGKKRSFGKVSEDLLPSILKLLTKYQIDADIFPTKKANHAIELAQNAKKEGYQMVIVVGGDGTTNEVANGLVDTNIPLGIIPVGTFMNVAQMLSIPLDLEKAIELIKIKKIRKIDLGMLIKLDGEKLANPYYFIETSGIGIEAHIQQEFKKLEKGDFSSILKFLKNKLSFPPHEIEITTQETIQKFQANLVTIANGPFSGASFEMAPDAKLNDHLLTVVVYKHEKRKLLKYFLRLIFFKKVYKKELAIIKAKEVTIRTKPEMLVHVDASLFGNTPVKFKIKSACLNVITGFPENPRTSHLIPQKI